MKMKKVLAIILVLNLVLLFCFGCGAEAKSGETTGKQPEAQGEVKDGFTIGTVEPVSMDATNKPLYDNLKHAVEAMGGTYLVTTVAEDSADGYLTCIQNLISAGADGIILSFFVSNYGLMPTIADMCEEAGVYWALFWNNIQEGSEDYQIAMDSPYFIASTSEDDVSSAYWAASIVGEMGCKNICTVTLPEGLTTTNLRNEGVEKACKEYGMNLLGTCSDRSLTYASSGGTTIAEDFMTVYPDMDGIVICGPQYVLPGVYKALKDSGRTDIQLTAIDFNEYQYEYMEDGILDGIIGGHFSGPVYSAILMANAIQGNPLTDGGVMIEGNFIELSAPEEAKTYADDVYGKYFYTDEELSNCLVKNNPEFKYEDLMKMVENYSLQDIIDRTAK